VAIDAFELQDDMLLSTPLFVSLFFLVSMSQRIAFSSPLILLPKNGGRTGQLCSLQTASNCSSYWTIISRVVVGPQVPHGGSDGNVGALIGVQHD
jgi:hypothetical protein